MPTSENLFELLKQDHRNTRRDLEDLIALCKDNEVDTELLTMCREELELHMRLEEEYLYPKAEREDKTEEIAGHAYDEHNEVKALLRKVREDATPETLAPLLQQVLEKVQHHVKEEENRLFPALEKIWDARFIEQLGRTVAEAREKELAAR